MKTLLQMEMYYVIDYTPTCRFLKVINSTLTCLVDYFLRIYSITDLVLYIQQTFTIDELDIGEYSYASLGHVIDGKCLLNIQYKISYTVDS
jgi:hypothetical protein